MGGHGAYKPRKFEVGEQLLALRTHAQLTQVELAALVGVSERSVQGWEAGTAYPQGDNLRHLISIFLTHGALTRGQEHEEALRLWQQVEQDSPRRIPHFDEKWFAQMLATHHQGDQQGTIQELLDSSSHTTSTVPQRLAQDRPLQRIIDWGEAPDVPVLVGRETELATLQQWVVVDRCRVVALLGLGGIGKTSLALTFANQAAAHFDAVFFRSLRNAPPLVSILDDLIQAASTQHSTLPERVADKITLLIQLFRERRYLLVLDNLETILQPGAYAGEYRTHYEEYGLFLQRLGEISHESCLLLTSREKPSELGPLEGRTAPVHSLSLTGLADDACRVILKEKDLSGMEAEVRALANLYGGNPLALKLISQPIREVFSGNLELFLSTGGAFFGAVGKLLEQQFQRSAATEQALLYWMAIERDFVSLDALQANFAGGLLRRDILIALESLWRRLLIERRIHPLAFSLQPVIMEFLTEQLVEQIHHEIVNGRPQLLHSHALVQATAKDHLRRSQEQLIATPLLEQLTMTFGGAAAVEQLLMELLQPYRGQPIAEQGYGPGNIVNLLRLLRGDLRSLDLSHLTLRGVYLQGVDMQDVRLAGTALDDCVLSEAFGIVHTVASTPSGSYWAASSINGAIRVWRNGGRTTHLSIPAHSKAVMALTFSPDEKLLATGSWDCTVKLWDLQSGALVTTLEGHTDYVQSLAFSPDGQQLASGSDDQTLRIWDVASGVCLQTIHAHTDNTYGVAWSPDGEWIATCGFDCLIHIWQIASGACVKTLQGHTQPVTKLAISPDGQMLASSSFDHTVRVWDIANAVSIQTFAEHTGSVNAIAWSPDGRTIASSSFDGTIRLWAPDRSTSQRVLRGHGATVYSIAFTADGTMLISGSDDQTVRVWDVANGWCVRVLKVHGVLFFGMAWSPDGRTLLSANSDASLTLWDVTSGKARVTLRGHTHIVYSVAWNPDGRWLASGGFDKNVYIWDVTTGNRVRVIQAHDDLIQRVIWSPDGKWLASTGRDQTVRLWDTNTGACRWVARGHTGPINNVVWSPDGQQLASCSEDHTVRLWRAADGAMLHTLSGHASAVASLAWSPDGRLVASCGGGGSVGELLLWDVERGECINSLRGHSSVISRVAWSQDSKLLFSGGMTGVIRWWDALSGANLHTQQGHRRWIRALSVSPDGSTLVSSGEDGDVHLWDIERAELIRTLRMDRPYERMDIRGLTGISEAQRAALIALGATEN